MRIKTLINSALIIMTLLIASAGIIVDADPTENPVNVSIITPDIVEMGNNFDLTINISYVKDFDAAQFDVSFDQTIINITGVTAGKINNTNVPLGGWSFIDAGKIRIIVNIPGVSGISGEGYLAKIQFKTISPGTSNINLSDGILGNNLSQGITAEWNNATVQIEGIALPEVSIELSTINLFNIKINFQNTGEINISGMKWDIQMNTVLTNRINFSDNGSIDSLNISEEKTVSIKMDKGIGFVKLKITATINEYSFSEELDGLKIGPILVLLI